MTSNVSFADFSAERRRRRSENPLQATRYQLAQVMEDFGLAACLIATEDGRLFAAPGRVDLDEAELLAALAGEALRCDWSLGGQVALGSGDEPIEPTHLIVEEFWAWDQPLVMLALGAHGPPQKLSLYRAILGIRRIARQALHRAA